MNVNNIQKLIDNPLQPNPAEWAMDVEDVLSETGFMTEDTKNWLNKVRFHNGPFGGNADSLVAVLKRIIKKSGTISDNRVKGDDIMMGKENVFVVYAHKQEYMMLKVKDFIQNTLGFDPKVLDISKHSGSIWDALLKEGRDCQKAVVLMSGDDTVISENKEYKQARPNVFIELGYFVCKYGLENVTLIQTTDSEIPSDIDGLIRIVYGTEDWKEKLRNQLNRK